MLRDYQLVDLAFYMAHPRCGNFSDPGTGKTPPTCVYTYYVVSETGKKAIWLQPSSLIRKNYDEMLRFTPFTPEELGVMDGTKKERMKVLEDPAVKVYFTTFNFFSKYHQLFNNLELVVVDEWQMGYRTHDSERSIQLIEAMKRIPRLVALTGTMVAGRLDSCYVWVKLIDPTIYYSYNSFMNRHAKYDFNKKLIGWRNLDFVKQIFSKYAIRRTLKDVYGDEEKVIQTEYTEMSKEQKKEYDLVKLQAELQINNMSRGVAAIRARQILAHPELVDDKVIMDPPTPKDELLYVHLDNHLNSKAPFIIFCSLIQESSRVYKMVADSGIPVGLINGNTPNNIREKVNKDFITGKIQCIVATPATAGVGFNWQFSGNKEVSHIIFTSMDYLDTSFFQAYRRCMRQPRQSPLLITILQYKNSIEQRIYEIVSKKNVLGHQMDGRPIIEFDQNEREFL